MNHFDKLTLGEIISTSDNLENDLIPDDQTNTIHCAFLRNITIDNLLPYLRYLSLKDRFRLKFHMGGYDTSMSEVMDSESDLYKFSPDYCFVFYHLKNLSPKLSDQYTSLSIKQIEEEKQNVVSFFQNTIHALRKNSSSKIIIKLLEIPVFPAYGVSDYQKKNGLANQIYEINSEIKEIANEVSNSYIIDPNQIISQLGYQKYYDNRYWYFGKAPYGPDALKSLSEESWSIIRALNGKTKKCLVVDCDNTLWGGIVGEDGISKIKIGQQFPGNIYLDLQKQILNLYNKGIILAINSKNNEQDVLEVLDEHPDMLLRKDHFAVIYANWSNKAVNMKNIAEDLNIGLNSIVFIDDSPFECELIRTQFPEVDVLQLPEDKTTFPSFLAAYRYFDSLEYSETDKKRPDLYRTETKRKKTQKKYDNIDDYYKNLEMELMIQTPNSYSIPRVSQLTQRTNQFNLTTKRYSEDDIKEKVHSEISHVYCIRVKDKFGDLGIVGAAILNVAGKTIEIDSFLLSCRVIGREIENVFLSKIIEEFIDKGFTIKSSYIRTNKNNLVSDFYTQVGFEETYNDEQITHYILGSKDQLKVNLSNFKKINFSKE